MPEQPQKLDLTSMDVAKEKKEKLKQLFPEVFREDKIDFDHLKRVLGEWISEKGRERFGLQWPGKAECMKIIQQPSIATLMPDLEGSINFEDTENLFIEGDNLEVLKLLQKSYFGKVKMIYLDPPYNTGNDFIYPDKYGETLDTYLKYTGQKDEEGNWKTTNRDTDGRFHTRWLNMMYPRLFLAKNLLKRDGVIFISIDDNESPHLKKICDEIFGEENHRNTIIVRRGIKNVQSQFENVANLSVGHEYILMYTKNSDVRLPKLYHKLQEKEDGKWDTFWRGTDRPTLRYELLGEKPEKGQWRWQVNRSQKAIENYNDYLENYSENLSLDEYYLDHLSATNEKLDFLRKNDDGVIQYYVPPRSYKLISDNWMDVSTKGREIGFDTEKHTELLNRMVDWILNEDEMLLDFFAGSCTTAHSVLDLNKEDKSNRKFIMVQLPEPTHEDSELFENGFQTIADIGKERIRRVIKEIEDEREDAENQIEMELDNDSTDQKKLDLGFKVFKLGPSNFKVWDSPEIDINPEELEEQLDVFADHIASDAKENDILYELILKSGYPLTTSIERKEVGRKTIFCIQNNALLIYLDANISFDILEEMASMEPERVVCLDQSFSGEEADALKTNAVQLFKSHDIAFRTV